MTPDQRALEILLLGLLIPAGALGQWRLWRFDRRVYLPRRLYLPLVVGGLVFCGFLLHAGLCLLDPNKPDFDGNAAFAAVGRGLCFLLVLVVQGYLSPLCVCWSLAVTVYVGFELQQLQFWPLLDLLFDHVFEGTPVWLCWGYKGGTFLYLCVASLAEGVSFGPCIPPLPRSH